MFAHDFIAASVVIGHDGSVRIMREIDHGVSIEKAYRKLYNEIKRKYPLKSLAEKITLDKLYELGLFVYDEK